MSEFKLTYATMFNPPEELHRKFEAALAKVRANLGKEHAMYIDSKDVFSGEKFEDRNPANAAELLGTFQKGDARSAQDALAAARKAFPNWSRMKWQDRVALVRKAADNLDQRLYEIGAVMALEVGKNRMESLGDVAETADLLRYSCTQMEKNDGYIVEMGRDPLVGFTSSNISVLRPYGVWLVISPFNFPLALTGGPAGAALVAGNTIVIKPSSDTPWVVRLLAECFRDAGLPAGVVNYVTGSGRTLGSALITCQDVDGVTFTGSFDVGMRIFRDFSECKWVRPMILELGGKNPVIVSRHADLERAASGIVRSAFGLQGQKCSAASRVYIEADVYEDLAARLKEQTEKLAIGDPTERKNFLGPVINQAAYEDYQKFIKEMAEGGGELLTGGRVFADGEYANGYFCAPTLVADLPYDHRLWTYEMFLPITTIGKVKNLDDAMQHANDINYGLTAGFYGSSQEVDWFFEKIEAGVTYANRPQGATTGAWPGFQPFGGWKGSGASGKNSGGQYYLPLYMHEQIHTQVQ
jgi:1-pyrroline-5-carboxylate dehydrogenase